MKRIISILLTAVMLMLEVPLGVFALGESDSAGELQTGENTLSQYSSAITPAGDTELISLQNKLEYEVWDGSINTDLEGMGTEESPYLIKNGADLMGLSENVNYRGYYYENNAYIRLECNIDMDMYGKNSGTVWTPIGFSESYTFRGHFDGAGHEIKGLRISLDDAEKKTTLKDGMAVGFFGYVKYAVIENLGIRDYVLDQSFSVDLTAGPLVGIAEDSVISNCYTAGDIDMEFEDRIPSMHPFGTVVDKFSKSDAHGYAYELYVNPTTSAGKTVTVGGDRSGGRGIRRYESRYRGARSFRILPGAGRHIPARNYGGCARDQLYHGQRYIHIEPQYGRERL